MKSVLFDIKGEILICEGDGFDFEELAIELQEFDIVDC
jgi:hypothetical protein